MILKNNKKRRLAKGYKSRGAEKVSNGRQILLLKDATRLEILRQKRNPMLVRIAVSKEVSQAATTPRQKRKGVSQVAERSNGKSLSSERLKTDISKNSGMKTSL